MMDWESKLAALNALAECHLIMRKPGDWYVSQQVMVKNNSVLEGRFGNGESPESAVEEHWQELTELAGHEYLVAREYWDGDVCKRAAVRWNGFMWDHVKEPAKAEAA